MSNPAAQLRKVLFVDDNLQFLEMIERLMGQWSAGEWQIFTALNAGKALLILQEHSIDLAVIDVQMPVVDGIQFLALLSRKYPSVQKVTLSAYGDEASRSACLSHGAELFFEKPRDPADLEIIFSTLRELARQKGGSTGFRGVLRHVSLQDVIQMECLNRNSSILEVKALKWTGQIFIREGAIIHAAAGARNGEAALNKILALKGGEFNLHPYEEPERQTIDGSWEFLLMEAARASDEAAESGTQEDTDNEEAAPTLIPKPAPVVKPPPQQPSRPAAAAQSQPVRFDTAFLRANPSRAGGERAVRIDEMVVCSQKGEVLYEWQSANASDRISFLEFLSRKSIQLGEGLNLGAFDRLEMEGEATRIIAQVKKDRGVFIHATKAVPGMKA